MLLKQIILRNIRSYVNETIVFPRGSVLLWGDIGSGKSTILLGIEFALFGLKRGELSGSQLLRNGKNEGTVELSFNLDQKDVIIKRSLKRTPSGVKQDSGHIIVNGIKTEATAVELKSKILDILGYPKDLVSKSKDLVFRYTIYTPQEAMKNIIFADKEERLDILRRVFNIDKYKRIRDNLQVIHKTIRDNVKEYEGRIYSLPEKRKQAQEVLFDIKAMQEKARNLIPRLKESKEKIAKAVSEINSLSEKEKDLNETKKNLELKNQSINNLDEQKKNYDNEVKKISAEKNNLQKKITELHVESVDIALLEKNTKELENEIENMENEYNKRKNNNDIISERIKSLKDNIRQYTKETSSRKEAEARVLEKKQELKNLLTVIKHKEDLEKNIEKIEKITEKLSSMITEKAVNLKNSEKIIDDIKEIDKCPTCHQDVSEEYKKQMRKEKNKRIEDLKKEHEELIRKKEEYQERLSQSKENIKVMIDKEKEIEKVKAEISSEEKSFKEFDLKKNLIKEYEEKIRMLEQKITLGDILQTMKNTVAQKKVNLKDMQKEYNKVKERKLLESSLEDKNKRISEINEYMKDYNNRRKELFSQKTSLEEKINLMKNLEKEISNKKKEHEEILEKDKELEIKKAEIIKEKNSLLKQKENLDSEIKEMLLCKKKILYLKEMRSWLSDYFTNLTVVIEKHIMQRVYHEFDELFRDWFSVLMETDVINVRLDEEFTPVIEQNGYETYSDNLSGGEKTSLALSYRLALNKVINDCIENIRTKDLLILDEPTDGFSSEQLDRIRDVLEQINIPQVIIVSHETKIESFVDSIIKVHKTEHVSRIV
ncbi:MAG: AAA family ATPase [Candidatus Woesearchaeota archaeon]